MKLENIIWTLIIIVAGIYIVFRASTGNGMGKAYVKTTENHFVKVVDPAPGPDVEEPDKPVWMTVEKAKEKNITLPPEGSELYIKWSSYADATVDDYHKAIADDSQQKEILYSTGRTVGIWVAALLTLAIFSFLYKDNPFYKIAESIVVGVSAAYWMVVGFWDVIVPNLLGKLWPSLVHNWAMPGLEDTADWWYLVPLVLGIMLLMRLSPKGGWISRWPLAFIIGTTAGFRMISYIHADFLSQIRNGIKPIYQPVYEPGTQNIIASATLWASVANVVLVVGVLSCLVYFFFSIEHKGIVGKTAKLGIWFLMVTFGAAFGYTVMGRIALLAIRLEFLFDDWLWIIDPNHVRPPGW